MRFTLKQLEYFVAAAEHGSIKAASEAIHISQPSISAAIAHLESELGVQLFMRHHAQGLSLTTPGRRLAREARGVLSRAQGLYDIAGEVQGAVRGPIRVGCFVTLAPMIMPELGQSFATRHPGVDFSVREGDHEALINALNRGEIDVAISYDLSSAPGIEFEPLSRLSPQALFAARHPLARRNSVRLAELAELPLILLDLPYSREYFLSLFYAQGLTPSIHARSAQPEVVRTMAANGYGYTLANVRPRSNAALDGRRLASVPLSGQHRPMVIGLLGVTGESDSRLLEAFRAHCRRTITQDSVPGMKL